MHVSLSLYKADLEDSSLTMTAGDPSAAVGIPGLQQLIIVWVVIVVSQTSAATCS